MTDKEVMQMALDAITDWGVSRRKVAETVEALRTALAQPEPELGEQYSDIVSDGGLDPRNKLQREWVGLTDEDGIEYPYPPAKPPIYATANNTKAVRDGFEMGGYEKEAGYYSEAQLDEFAQAIEAKLKEKNT